MVGSVIRRHAVNDIAIGDFAFPWELKNGKKGPVGTPEAKYWAVEPAGAEQAGTVYSVQGFEFRHVGVLMGSDLVVRDERWVANPKHNFRNSIRARRQMRLRSICDASIAPCLRGHLKASVFAASMKRLERFCAQGHT